MNGSPAHPPAIGVDIGGTKIAVAAVDPTGRILAQTAFATEPQRGFDDAVGRLRNAIVSVVAKTDLALEQLPGIGIGCAGPVDPAQGTIHNPYTLPGWDGANIVTALGCSLSVPVYLENDADAALLGEAFAGAARGCDPVVMLTFGTGIGGAVLAQGRIYRGLEGGHPEIGHIPADRNGPECYCGLRGCLESIASGTAIGTAGAQLGLPDSRAVFAAANNGHPGARAVIDRAVRATVHATWTLLHTFMPQRIVFGGGLMEEHFEVFAAPAREQLARATMLPQAKPDIVPAGLGNDAALAGAASLVFARRSQGRVEENRRRPV